MLQIEATLVARLRQVVPLLSHEISPPLQVDFLLYPSGLILILQLKSSQSHFLDALDLLLLKNDLLLGCLLLSFEEPDAILEHFNLLLCLFALLSLFEHLDALLNQVLSVVTVFNAQTCVLTARCNLRVTFFVFSFLLFQSHLHSCRRVKPLSNCSGDSKRESATLFLTVRVGPFVLRDCESANLRFL